MSRAVVVLTGANGFLGKHILHILLEHGYAVRALVRIGAKFNFKSHPNLQIFEGDVHDKTFLYEVFKQADYAVHAAAVTSQSVSDYKCYHKVNVTYTMRLYEAAENAHIKRFIFISSANTIQPGTYEKPGVEGKDADGWMLKSNYIRSKAEAEKALKLRSGSCPFIILNPAFIIGPNEAGTGSGIIFKLIRQSRIQFVPAGGKSFVYVEDVAMAVMAAFDRGISGQNYLLSAYAFSFIDFYKACSQLIHKKLIIIVLPRFLLRSIAYIGDLLVKIGVNTSFTSVNVNILNNQNVYDGTRVCVDLGIIYTDFRTVLFKSLLKNRKR